ncbi:MAG: hypothetical protein ACRDJH_02805, partial [Thermomicrobiales bacterium]
VMDVSGTRCRLGRGAACRARRADIAPRPMRAAARAELRRSKRGRSKERPYTVRAARGALLLLVLLALLAPLGAVTGEELNHAGVVVRYGDERLTYAYVAFPEEEITGAELLERTGIPIVTVTFGGLGAGVCSIDREGCSAGECRRRVCQGPGNESPFWQYFRQDAPGDWRPLVLGASATKVRDGDVDGWSWTPEEPELPAVTIEDVARLAGVTSSQESPAAGTAPIAAARDVYPAGVTPASDDGGQGPLVYAGAAAILAGLGVAAVVAVRRGRPPEESP